jgi:hypothetical protein
LSNQVLFQDGLDFDPFVKCHLRWGRGRRIASSLNLVECKKTIKSPFYQKIDTFS